VDEIDDRSPDSPRPAPLPELRVDGPWCLRWRDRRHSWRHRSDGGFDPDRYRVAPIEEATAKAFVTAHHYSGTYPAAVRRYGMWDQPTGQLVGVAVYGVPMSLRVLTNVLPDLEPLTESLELIALCCLMAQATKSPSSWRAVSTSSPPAACAGSCPSPTRCRARPRQAR